MQVNNWLNIVHSSLFPARCALCGGRVDYGAGLCSSCHRELPFNNAACPQCALPVAKAGTGPCGRCIRRPPPFTSSRVPLRYEAPFSRLIGEFKFRDRLHLAAPLSHLFCAALPWDQPRPDLLLPIPLHPRRLCERGFNQSLELGRRIAADLSLELDWRSIRRIRATPPQSSLDRHARERNLRSAFVADAAVKGLHVALFDDVITTGATVTSASLALLKAGAKRVDIWALARTPPT